MVFAVFLLGLPMLGGASAFDTASSIATAGLCLAYALPIGFRIMFAHHSFEPGPFSLGRYCHPYRFMHSGPCALSVQCRYLVPLYQIPFCGSLDAGFAAVMQLLTFSLSCLQARSLTCRPACKCVLTCLPDCRIASTQSKLLQQIEPAWRKYLD